MKKLLLIAVTLIPFFGLSQSVVINKYFNGTTTALDAVELLVITDNLDMRGMILKDFSSSMANDSGRQFTFSTDALWASVRSGTLIVLRNDATAADISATGVDFNLDLGLANTTYFTATGGTFDIATTEMIMIKAAGSGPTGITSSIHVLAGGTAGTQFTNAAAPKLIATGTSATGNFVFANNTNSLISDYNGTDATGTTPGLTFGSGNNATNTIYITSLRNAVLPVTLTAFNGKINGQNIDLNWQTQTEQNNAYFDVLRANDGNNFKLIGKIIGVGNSQTVKNYSFTDTQPLPGTNYYQLKQVDFDGKVSLSNLLAIKSNATASNFKVFSNRDKNAVELIVFAALEGKSTFKIYDLSGRKLIDQNLQLVKGFNTFSLSVQNTAQGLNVATLTTGKETITNKFIQ